MALPRMLISTLRFAPRTTLPTRLYTKPSTRNMSSGSAAFLAAVANRRSYYGLKNESPIPDSKIVEIVQTAVKHVPSTFNMQSARAVVFFHDESVRVWDIVEEEFLKTLAGNEEQIAVHKPKIAGYKAGYGSVAFFEDQASIQAFCDNMPAFTEAFKTWSETSSGMHQFAVWTALEAEGFGANLQHHFSFADAIPVAVGKAFDIPSTWKCTAILPFGVPVGPPGNPARPKTFLPIEDRVKVAKLV